jgi:hypothetical protein
MLKKHMIFAGLAATLACAFAHDGAAAGIIAIGYAAETEHAQQTSNERGIKMTVLLHNIPQAAQTWDFEVTLETHTQALNDDLSKSAVLIAGGRQYLPVEWQGAPPGGHHRKGLLRFKAVIPQPGPIELQIRLAGDTSARSFKWALK